MRTRTLRREVPRSTFDTDFRLDDAQVAAIEVLTRSDRKGVYLWGPVGRGKTWILDRYFDAVTTPKKRVHFHSFFRDLHASYFRNHFSLERTLDELLGNIEVLCFDEFHVHDVGDGRLISRMLDALFARKIVLVLTSNYPPDGLLPHPLFHDSFVPAIELLKAKLQTVRVDGPVDYRTHRGSVSGFAAGTWSVNAGAGGVSFAELCDSPKSTGDYLSMIEQVETLTITGVPRLADADREAVQRFSNLVDVLYDAGVPTHFHSDVGLDEFAQGCNGLDIERIVSRLCELHKHEDKRDAHS